MSDNAFKDFFNSYKSYAAILKENTNIDYQTPGSATTELLLNGYRKAKQLNDDYNQNLYLSALIVRNWYVLDKYYRTSPNIGYTKIDFIDWIYKAIDLAVLYHAWDTKKDVSADQALNQCFNTVRLREYYKLNLKKNKASVNTISLDNTVVAEDDDELTLGETEMFSTDMQDTENAVSNRLLVQNYFDQNKFIEAIIIDALAFSDLASTNSTKSIEKRCSALLHKLNNTQVIAYFKNNYNVPEKRLSAVLSSLSKQASSTLAAQVADTIEDVKNNYYNF
jgi:hypothetical protein